MKKIIMFLCLLMLPFLSLNAKIDNEDVNYSVEGLYINGNIEIAGAVKFKEIIKVSGTFNGYERDLIYKNNNIPTFTGKKDDFKGSSIYNADNIIINKVGILQIKDFKYENFTEEYINENVKLYNTEGYGKYELSSLDNGTRVRMYNETYSGVTYFYIEYTVTNLIVEHNDSAEFYYNIIGQDFDDKIGEVIAIIYLPEKDENMRLWAHGPLDGEVYSIEGGYGAILKINNLSRNVPVDLRMVYSKKLFPININEHKKSNMDALPHILEIEENRAEEANKERKNARFTYYTFIVADSLYLIGLIGVFIYIYVKYDKEYKSGFNNEYYREFIDDYDVEVVDYIMKKYITENAFSASILNLIYKKKISVTKINDSKDDYLFTLNTIEGISESENKIIELLFSKIGLNKEVKMSEIKKTSKGVYNKTHNIIYDSYTSWKSGVERQAKGYNFYINNWKIKILLILYALLGIGLFAISVNIGMLVLPIIVLFTSIIFILYSLLFSKRTVRGNEDYKKWRAFKKFLLDFGRFNEKELPEIILWERYLVYATVFGIADKVSKVMKVKFEQMNVNDTSFNHTLYNMYIFNNMSRDISRSINTSISNSISTVAVANSKNSSGGGFGGGFSGGGGFGGGGGGGRGF